MTRSGMVVTLLTYQSGADFSGGFSGNIVNAAQMANQTRAYSYVGEMSLRLAPTGKQEKTSIAQECVGYRTTRFNADGGT